MELRLSFDPQPGDLVFEGIGAVSAGASSRLLVDYPEPQRSQILDLLFLPGCGAAYQSLKVEVGSDMNATDGTEPSHLRKRDEPNFERGWSWWLMKEAVRRNPDIQLGCLAWGAPGWFEGGFWSQDCADYYVAFLRGAREVHGLNLSYMGLWNERPYDPAWVKLLRRTLDRAGFGHVSIVASDMNGPEEHQYQAAFDAANDPELLAAVDVFGVHYPYSVPPAPALAHQRSGKRLWSSEEGEWNWDTMRPLPGLRARKLNQNIVERRFTKTLVWSLVSGYFDCLPAPDSGVVTATTPWSGAFAVKPELWHTAHTTQFVQPGWTLVGSASRCTPEASVATYRSPSGDALSVVAEALGATEPVRVELSGLPSGRLGGRVTAGDLVFAPIPGVDVIDGTATFTIPAGGVLSLTSGSASIGHGEPVSPPAAPFPLPYRDAFADLRPGQNPRYLIDFSWAFEGAEDPERGTVLRQVIERQGITWIDLPYACTYTGDASWTDVSVQADVCLEAGSDADDWAGVVLRALPGATWDAFKTPYPNGVTLRVHRDGRWSLVAALETLAQGRFGGTPIGWRTLQLVASGERFVASIDGHVVGEVVSAAHSAGLVGLACGNHPARFSAFSVSTF